VVVAATGSPHLVLAIDAVTFVASAALLRWGIRPHLPEPEADGRPRPGPGRFAFAGITLVTGDRRLLGLASVVWLFGCFVVPEALAAPYADQIGAGTAAVGALMAANLVGMMIGAVLAGRLGPDLRRRLTVPLGIATGLPLVATMAGPSLLVTVVLWALSGLLSCYLVLAQITFTQLIPDHLRGRAIGFTAAGLQTAQGIGMAIGGALAEVMPPSMAIAICAGAGSFGAVAIGIVFPLDRDGTSNDRSSVPVGDRAEPSRQRDRDAPGPLADLSDRVQKGGQ
jgi:predicted MFS family arabinose efflux permease